MSVVYFLLLTFCSLCRPGHSNNKQFVIVMVRDSHATESQQQKVNKSHDSRDPPSLSEETEVNIGIKVEVKLSTYTFTQNFRLLE